MADGGVEFYYVEADKVVLVHVLNFFKPVDHRCRVFPLVEIGCSLDFVVDSIEDVFADLVGLINLHVGLYIWKGGLLNKCDAPL